MQKHDGECAIEKKNDLPRETARFVGGPDFLQHDAEPVLDPLLVRAAREDRRMSRQVDELDRSAQEPAPLPLGMPRRRRQIAENAGKEGALIVDSIIRSNEAHYGYDAARDEFVDMLRAGIIDPKKVTRVALENAASVAGMILTTECALIDIKEESVAPMGGGMPGMM